MTSPSSSDSSSDDSDDSGAERRRRVASITTHVSAEVSRREVVSRAEQTQSRRGDSPVTAASRDERAFQKQAAVLLHRYLDQHLETAAPEAAAAAGRGDHEDAGDFRVFASVPRGAPVVSGHGLLACESADDGAGRVSRSEARRRARPRKRLQSDSDDEEKVIARANQVAVDAANIVAAATRAAATAAAQLQACRAIDSDEDAVVIDRTPAPRKARPPVPPASCAEGNAGVASGPKLSQRAKKKAKQLAAAQMAACQQ